MNRTNSIANWLWPYLSLPGWILLAAMADAAPQVQLLRVPGGGVQPQAVVDSSGAMHLVYLSGDPKACDVMYVRRTAGQTNFSSPLRVNSIPGSAIAIGTVRGAQIAVGRNGRLHVAWNGSDQASPNSKWGSPMLYTRLNDSGSSFEAERNLMTSTMYLDGGGSVAADAQGHVYVVWHAHKRTGPKEEIDRGVFVAFSDDGGKTFTSERQVNTANTGVCGCCGLKTFADDVGSLAILYRSAGLSGNRDSVLLVSTNFGKTFVSRVLGEWHVSTCPMSTHALGLGIHGLTASWEKNGQIYISPIFTEPPESPLGAVAASGVTGNRKHPTFAFSRSSSGALLLAWTEGTGWERGGSLAWQCINPDGSLISSGRTAGVPVWDFAAAVAEPDGSFCLIY